MTVDQLCGLLYVSAATVRRDLQVLESSNLIKRIRGGAILIEGNADEDPMLLREQQDVLEKQLIAGKAAKYITDGMTLFLDSSSTAYYLARALKGRKNLRVITNGIKTASCLADYDGVTVMCACGTIRPGTKSAVGNATLNYIKALRADIAFISCRGYIPEQGAYEANEDEYYIKRLFMANSLKTILLCTKNKFGDKYLYHLAEPDDFDVILSE